MAGIVVLVDDNRDWVESNLEYLRDEGMDVRSAFDGRQAVELLDSVDPAIVVLDVNLPILDGFHVLQRIRSTSPTTPVLMVSANDVEREAISRGANLFLRKPVSTTLLARTLRQILNGS